MFVFDILVFLGARVHLKFETCKTLVPTLKNAGNCKEHLFEKYILVPSSV